MSEYLLLRNKSKCCNSEIQVVDIGGGFGSSVSNFICLKCKRELDNSDIIYIGNIYENPELLK